MKKLTLITVLLIGIYFNVNQEHREPIKKMCEIKKVKKDNGFTVYDKLYTVHFEIENTNNQNPILVVSMKLHNDSFYVSPFAKRDFKGKFDMNFGDYTHLEFKGNVIETPRSIEEYDPHPFVNGTVNWVRVNTTYKQTLQIKSITDFNVFGKIRFTIEPRCSLEEIPFAISCKNGVFQIKNIQC